MVAKKTSEKPEARDSVAPAAQKASTTDTSVTDKKKRNKKNPLQLLATPFTAGWAYLKGSWHELRQVFWPSRRATWGLTLAVILFTAFFTVVIIALDSGFEELFKRILL